MTIATTCQCGKKYQVKEELAGKRVKCPACGESFEVPPPQVDSLEAPSTDPLGLGSGKRTEAGPRKRKRSAKQFFGKKTTVAVVTAFVVVVIAAISVKSIVDHLRATPEEEYRALLANTMSKAEYDLVKNRMGELEGELGEERTEEIQKEVWGQSQREKRLENRLMKFYLAMQDWYNAKLRPEPYWMHRPTRRMTSEEYEGICRDFKICWDKIPDRIRDVKETGSENWVVAFHRQSFLDKDKTVLTLSLYGDTDMLPYEELVDKLKQMGVTPTDAYVSALDDAPNVADSEMDGGHAGVDGQFGITNSIGMKFVLIPAGEFMMGFPTETPQHKVRITKPFYLGVTEVTQEQYEKVMGENPSGCQVKGTDTSNFPIENVSWEEALEFCKKLSAKEGVTYWLPTEAEWEYACRAGSTTLHCFGDEESKLGEYAWFDENSNDRPHRVGTRKPNAWGVHDMHGNVWEYCQDWYKSGYYAESPTEDPPGPSTGSYRVIRGGSCYAGAYYCWSSQRKAFPPSNRGGNIGFRVARGPSSSMIGRQPAVEPETVQDETIELETVTDSIGMKFKLIPAGEFMMGGTVPNASPQHKVRITRPFYLGVNEVTQEQYEKIMGENPSCFSKTGNGAIAIKGIDTSNFPVENVNWEDAVEFCKKLSAKEGVTYRLPTEAEWEYACRAGSTTRYCFGVQEWPLGEYAWFNENSNRPHPVETKKPNAWGLHDMHGNVWEWCQDWYEEGYYAESPPEDPTGPAYGSFRVYRGGSWDCDARRCRSSHRNRYLPTIRGSFLGFRVAR